jgi:hypothetical protein
LALGNLKFEKSKGNKKMKNRLTLLIFVVCVGFIQAQDSTFVKKINYEIAEKDTLISYLQNALIQDAFDKNISIQIGKQKFFFRDEIIRKQELEKLRELYLKEKTE